MNQELKDKIEKKIADGAETIGQVDIQKLKKVIDHKKKIVTK